MTIVSKVDSHRGNLLKIDLATIPFQSAEVFTISNVPVGVTRGHHAHRETEQFLLLIQGEIELRIENSMGTKVIHLNNPGDYYYLPTLNWGEEKFLKEGTILQVYASLEYDQSDYITDLSELHELWRAKN
jgi:hypothetical protein